MSERDRLRLVIEMIVAIAAMVAGSAFVRYAHGQTMNNQAAATINTRWLQAAIDRGEVTIPIGVLYINDTIKTPAKVGCGRVSTRGSGGYYMPPHPVWSGTQSVICQLKQNAPIFRLCGAGFIATDPLGLWGNGTAAAIEVEGREYPATGRHRFAGLVFYNWAAAFKALGGYYKDNQFIADPNHGDNCTAEKCEAFDCGRLFWSQNEQAVNWVFRDCIINSFAPPAPFILADIEQGGLCEFDHTVFCTNQVTLFRVKAYSPNTARLVCRNLEFDRVIAPETRLTPIEYVGYPDVAAWADYVVRINGFACQYLKPENKVPANMPRGRWKINIESIYTQP